MTQVPTAPLELDEDLAAAWGMDGEQTPHDRKMEAARQPDLAKLKAGDEFEVMDPIYRLASVERVQLQPEPRAIVNCRSFSRAVRNKKGEEVVEYAKWTELWGLRTIPTQDYEEDVLAVHKAKRPLRIGGTDADVPKTTYVAVLNEQGRSELHMNQSCLKNTRVMVVLLETDASKKPQAAAKT